MASVTGIGEQSLRWFAAERVEAEPDLTVLVHAYSGLLYRVALSVLSALSPRESVTEQSTL